MTQLGLVQSQRLKTSMTRQTLPPQRVGAAVTRRAQSTHDISFVLHTHMVQSYGTQGISATAACPHAMLPFTAPGTSKQ